MAKYNQGLLAQFSGKVGPVVGSSWKGISYLRSNPRKTRNRDASMKTEIQTAKFKLASSFVKAIASLLLRSLPTVKSTTITFSILVAPNTSWNYRTAHSTHQTYHQKS